MPHRFAGILQSLVLVMANISLVVQSLAVEAVLQAPNMPMQNMVLAPDNKQELTDKQATKSQSLDEKAMAMPSNLSMREAFHAAHGFSMELFSLSGRHIKRDLNQIATKMTAQAWQSWHAYLFEGEQALFPGYPQDSHGQDTIGLPMDIPVWVPSEQKQSTAWKFKQSVMIVHYTEPLQKRLVELELVIGLDKHYDYGLKWQVQQVAITPKTPWERNG
ncbi:MAG: hypothetical protein VXY77_00025 [Pseudomonadota bacterium]|nr:hypothetical protein [Pseudomonadota bacterium]